MPLKVDDTRPVLMIFPFGLMSHYLRCLQLAKHLSPCFKIYFQYSDQYDAFITSEGFNTFKCESLDAEKAMKLVKKFNFSWMNERDLHRVFKDQVRIIEQIKPVAVLGDTSATLKMAAEKTGVLFVSLMNGYMSKFYKYTREISRTHPVYTLMKMLPPSIREPLAKKGEALAMIKVHQPFKKIRNRYQLNSRRSYLDELEGDINLVCDLDELFPQNSLPSNYKMIAPLYHDVPMQQTELLERLDPAKKTIYVTMGSSGDWQKVLFLNEPIFQKYNIVTSGDNSHILNGLHIINKPFINYHELFPKTDLVICHGGNGSIYQSLFYGIPVLSKTTHFEQEWNMAALERLGVGRSLDDVKETAELVRIVDEWAGRMADLSIYRERINAANIHLEDAGAYLFSFLLLNRPQSRMKKHSVPGEQNTSPA